MSNETRLSIRISKEELQALKTYAESNGKTFSDWVRETLLDTATGRADKIEQLEKRLAAIETKFKD